MSKVINTGVARGCNCTHGFLETPIVTCLEFAPTVLKESSLIGNETKLHPHFEIPNATPAILASHIITA